MSQVDQAWGQGPSARYEDLAGRYRPVFERIGAGAVDRELTRGLPVEQIGWLKAAGFGAVRLPAERGGAGASLPELFNLLVELSAADTNVTQALRAHFGFVEGVLNASPSAFRDGWLERIARGDIVGGAWSEAGDAKQMAFSTRLTLDGGRLELTGTKFYTTGSLYADWIQVAAQRDGQEQWVTVLVPRDAVGVEVVDDWNGFGQTLTASGTARFSRVAVADEAVMPDDERFRYGSGFYQLVHLATLAGLGRAATGEVAKAVAERRRHYTHAAGPRASQDPQVLQVVGRMRGAAYSAGAIVLKVAEALQRAFDARSGDEDATERANAVAELETAQAQTVVTTLILDACTVLFDALGASAVLRTAGLDRFWRNARTLSSHNPRIYKDRIVGDYSVNGTPPPYQWRIGVV